MKFRLREWHIYTVLWFWVLLYPVAHKALDNSSVFSWSEVWENWLNFIPFIILFFIHNRLIIPKFPLPRRTTSYVLATLGLLVVFTFFQYVQFTRHDFEKDAPPHAKEQRPPAPKPHSVEWEEEPFNERPRLEKRKPGPPDKERAPAYIMDCVIALLMLGCNQAVVLLFRMQKQQEQAQLQEQERLEHELKYLKAQLNPHFLMNMLNNIHTMIEVNPEKAEEMVINFSKLMRYVLYDGGKQLVPLSNEVAFIANYVVLMEQRCSNKKVKIDLSLPECISDKIMVPPLLSIVFIENAFKHGISYQQPSFIHISLSITADNRLCLRCENSIPTITDNHTPSEGGIGLKNVRKRLELLFGHNYVLDIQTTSDIYSVTLNIPIYDEKHSMPGGR